MQNINTLPTLSNITVPAAIAARMAAPSAVSLAIMAGASKGEAVPKLSLKQGRFRIVEDGTEMVVNSLHLDVAIIGAVGGKTRAFYAKRWTPDQEASAPDCYSIDGVYPSPRAEQKQCETCAACPQSQWGSKINENGKETRACTESRRVCLVSADDVEGSKYQLNIPTMSMKPFESYVKELTARNIPVELVRTRLSFDANASYPKLQFQFAGFLAESDIETVAAMAMNDDVKHILGLDDVAQGPAQLTPQAAPAPRVAAQVQQAAPAPAPAPVVEAAPAPVVEIEQAPVQKKRGFAAAGVAVQQETPAAAPKKRGFAAAAVQEPVAAPQQTGGHAGIDALANELGDMFGSAAADL